MKLTIGILGFANIAQKAIIPTLLEMNESFHLKAIGTSSEQKIKRIRKEVKGVIATSYQGIVSNPGIDAVYIPLPNSLHFEWIKAALEANKHVLCEKSLACSFEEVEVLCQLAKEKGLALLENFQFRKHEQLGVIKSLLANGEIGAIRFIRSSFCFPPFPDQENIRYNKTLGGGALLDAGAYPLKLAKELLGDHIYLKDASLNFEDKEVDIWGSGTIYDQNLVPLQFSFGFDHQYQCNLEIIGSEGIIRLDRIYTAPPNHTVKLIIQKNNNIKEISIEPMNHYQSMLEYFKLCIQDVQLQEVELKGNLLQAKLLSQFYKMATLK